MRLAALAFVFVALLAPGAASAAELVVSRDFAEAPGGPHASLFLDESGEASFADIEALPGDRWTPSTSSTPNFGYRRGALWVRLQVRDARVVPEPLVVDFAYPPVDEVTLEERRADGTIERFVVGDHVRHSAWPRRTLLPSFLLAPSASHDLLFRVTDASLQAPIVVRSEANARDRERVEDIIVAAYFAAVLALALYNLLLFVGTGLRIYGVYVTYVVSFALFVSTMNGVGAALLWPSSPFLSDRAPVFFASVAVLAVVQIVVDLLGLTERSDRAARMVMGSRPLLVALAVATIVAPFPWALAILSVLVVVAVAGAIAVSIGDAVAGSRPARLFLLAFSVLLVAIIAVTLANAGVIELGMGSLLTLPAGSALELILLAFALADRIKALQHEATHQAELARTFAEEAKRSAEHALAEQARTNRELERLAKLKDAFLANTSHELRTPLNGILGIAEITLSGAAGALPSGVSRNLGIIRSSARRLGSLVNDILDFSKIRDKGLALRLEAVRLHEVVASVLAMLEPLAVDKDLRMVAEIDDAIWVRADAGRLHQMLTNLVGNAIKFTFSGSVVVRASVLEGRVHVSIADTGVGIAEADRERIFNSFEQGDGSAAREQSGTGLGLAVTQSLAQLHGGAVRVESRLAHGSTFTFDVEACAPGDDETRISRLTRDDAPRSTSARPTQESVVARLPALNGESLRVLVVDDEPVNREVLAQHLGNRGFEVELLSGGQAAIERLADTSKPSPDLVLLDVMMPGTSGYDVLEALRPLRPLEELPILLLTAKAREADLATGYALGASDYLLKPVSFVELDARLSHHTKLVLATRAERDELSERRRLQGELATTEAKLADSQALATLGTLVAGIAHDLRNPLQFIMSAVEQLRDASDELLSDDPENRAKALTTVTRVTGWVETGATKMEAISRAMLNQSRTDHERTLLVLSGAIEEAWLLCRGRAASVDVTFAVSDASVYVDPVGFGQLVMNLVSNAADALNALNAPDAPDANDAPRAKRIHVEAVVEEGFFSLRVHDSGPGVPLELRERIREAFFTTKPRGQGTGLGLAIVCRVAEAHEGAVVVDESPLLGGALFHVRWPNRVGTAPL
jgi:signal transduction histidine kinase